MAAAAKKCLGPWWLMLLLVLLWSVGVLVECRTAGVRDQGDACKEAPTWTAQYVNALGEIEERLLDPMRAYRGNVVLVALTAASSKHSLEQAHELASLESFFHGINMSDVTFLLVNAAESQEQLQDLVDKNLTLNLFQESLDNPVWSKLRGKKDHVFIYDRCGRLTYSIPFPMSIIHPRQQLVESALISTYLDDLCGDRKCNVEEVNATTEDSVESEMLNSTHNILVNVTQVVNMTDQLDFGDEEEELGNITQNVEQNHWGNHSGNQPQLQERSEEQNKVMPPQNSLWSLFHKIWKHMPWTSDERLINSVRKFKDEVSTAEPQEALDKVKEDAAEQEEILCNITRRSTCKSWPKKKLDHARICCNLTTCNASQQHQQKHCKHYSKHRCEKVEHILKCCYERSSENDENVNPRALASADAKS